MRRLLLLALLTAGPALADPLPAGTWTNAEDQYFRGEAGEAIPFRALRVEAGADGPRWQAVDAFGAAQSPWTAGDPPVALQGTEALFRQDGIATRLRLARPFRCWVSIKRRTPRPDGREDWSFHRDLALHDQGGRLLVPAEADNAPAVQLRMRNVVWPAPSPNRPSLVLYVHTPDQPDKAVSYSWADPGARMLGINLRWMQASCTLAD